MNARDINVFIDGVTNYFDLIANEVADVGTPYLMENDQDIIFDFTGVIGISGSYKGSVYFTAPSALLNRLLLKLGEDDLSQETMVDLIGEVANTISGNARSVLGSNFMISVPFVFMGDRDNVEFNEKERSFVIPINWRNYRAAIVVCVDKQ